MGFKAVQDEVRNTQPFRYNYSGVDAEAYVEGEIVKLVAGELTKADVTSAGLQDYVIVKAEVAATPAEQLVAVRLRETQYYKTTSPSILVEGLIYTLDATATGVTTTTTAGVFKVTSVIDATNVIGYFVTAE